LRRARSISARSSCGDIAPTTLVRTRLASLRMLPYRAAAAGLWLLNPLFGVLAAARSREVLPPPRCWWCWARRC
jgi:hypothetical protein